MRDDKIYMEIHFEGERIVRYEFSYTKNQRSYTAKRWLCKAYTVLNERKKIDEVRGILRFGKFLYILCILLFIISFQSVNGWPVSQTYAL